MKKMICMLALSSLGVAATAQSTAPTQPKPAVALTVEEMEIPVDRYRVITNYFWDNWFISAAGGAQVLFGDQSDLGSFGQRIAPALQFSVGKWFTPGLGLRLQYSGLQARSFSSTETDYSRRRHADGYYKDRWNYMNLHGDIMLNVSQMIMGYNPQRVYNLIPFVGFGWAHSYTAPHQNLLTVNFGIQQSFRLGNALDLNWELFGMATENRFDGKKTSRGLDVMLGTTVGLTLKFPRRNFQNAPDTEALLGLTAAQMAAINDALAQQIAQNNQLKAQLSEQSAPVMAEEVIVNQLAPIPQSVFFNIGSAQLPATAEVNLQSIASFVKDNPGVILSVKGYADSNTGSSAWNEQLSRERAEAVAKELERLGVMPGQMNVSGQGGVDTLTPASFNRRVIIEAE
jgi:outer membrane protein OmpA-like peptidoglycan-associated protein